MNTPDRVRILVGIENRHQREMIGEMLQKRGYQTVLAEKRPTILSTVREAAPAVALLDLPWEKQADFGLVRDIQETSPAVTCILAASSVVFKDGLKPPGLEDVVLLRKPYELSELLDTVRQALETHQHKKKYRQLKRRHAHLLEHLRDGVMQTNHQGILIAVNQTARRLLGLSEGNGLGKALPALLPLENGTALHLKDLEEGEWEIPHPEDRGENGRCVLSLRGVPLFEQDRYAGSLYFLKEKRSERSFEEIRRKYRALYDHAPLAYQALDEEGCLRDVNPAWLRKMGYEREEVIGKPFAAFLHPDWQETFQEKYPRFKRLGYVKDIQCRIQHQQGHYLDVSFEGQIEYREDGRFRRAHCVFKVITKQIEVEDQLRLQSKALEATANAIVITDVEGAIEWANPAFARLTGYEIEEVIGQNPRFLKSGYQEEEFYAELWDTILDGEVWHNELINQRKDGSHYTEEMTITPVYGQQGKIGHFIAVKQDVTERKKAERERQHSAEQFETLYEMAWDLAGEQDLRELLHKIVIRARELFSTQVSSIYLYDSARDELEMAAVEGYEVPLGTRIPMGEGLVGRVAQKRTSLALQDYRKWEGRLIAYEGVPLTSVLQVPMLYAGELVGVLSINEMAPHIRKFTPDDENLLSLLATSAAGAVHSARSFQTAQRRLEKLMSLQKIDKAISGVLDRGMMLRILLRQIVSQLEVDAACILLHDPHLDMLGYGAGEGFKTDNFRHTNLRVGERFAGQVALERRIIHIEDLRKHEADFLKKPDFEREGFLTYFGVPLITKGQVIGVLEVFHRMVFQPDQEWVDFLNTMAGQVAIAIDNINMFTAIQKAHRKLALAYDHTLEGWARALEIRDMETEGHSRRVTRMAVDLARVMGIHGQDLAHFRRGALLHDIGKMAIPDQILRKPGPLNEEEWEIMYRHPRYAYEMLKEIDYLRPALDIPYCHHEKWDGTGYPRGLKGEEIPLAARVFAVVDYWDALTSDRPYRDAWSEEKALAHIREESGKHFDPRVVDVFLMLLEEWRD